MTNEIFVALSLVLMLVTHELGHALMAKKDGIFKGFGILPNPHCKLTHPYNNRWKYLSGIAGSFISMPLFVLAIGIEWWWLFPIFAIGSGILDLFVVAFYGKVAKYRKL